VNLNRNLDLDLDSDLDFGIGIVFLKGEHHPPVRGHVDCSSEKKNASQPLFLVLPNHFLSFLIEWETTVLEIDGASTLIDVVMLVLVVVVVGRGVGGQ
jgi:hypothetical protein